jgi:hypothetical protein
MQDFSISISIHKSVCNEKRTKMKITFYLYILMLILFRTPGFCQDDGKSEPIKVTLCELAEKPDQYIGKMVQVRASVMGNDLWIEDFEAKSTCSSWMGIVVVLTNDIRPKPDFDTLIDENLKKFFDDFHKGMDVSVNFEGQFEAVYTWRDKKQIWINESKNKKKGFGKKGDYGGRIILHRISDVLSRPIPSL